MHGHNWPIHSPRARTAARKTDLSSRESNAPNTEDVNDINPKTLKPANLAAKRKAEPSLLLGNMNSETHLDKVARLNRMGFTRDMADYCLSQVEGEDLDSALTLLIAARASQNYKSLLVNFVFVLFAPTSAAIVRLFQVMRA